MDKLPRPPQTDSQAYWASDISGSHCSPSPTPAHTLLPPGHSSLFWGWLNLEAASLFRQAGRRSKVVLQTVKLLDKHHTGIGFLQRRN